MKKFSMARISAVMAISVLAGCGGMSSGGAEGSLAGKKPANADGGVDLNNPLLADVRLAGEPPDSDIQRAADAILADGENYNLDVTLTCPIQDIYLDGSAVATTGYEKIKMVRSRTEKTKDGWGPVTMTDVKILSNEKTYEASLVASGPSYAIIAYGNRLVDGISSNLFSVNYLIDLTTKRISRLITFFPRGAEIKSTAQCV